MKKLIVIIGMIFVLGFTSCEKSTVEPESASATIHCDISYRAWIDNKEHNHELTNQVFTGTPTEIEQQKSNLIIVMNAQGLTKVNIHNCK